MNSKLNGDLEPLIALCCYCLSSIAMTALNKYVLSQHKFHLNFFLLLIQVQLPYHWPRVPSFNVSTVVSAVRNDVVSWFPVSLGLVLMIFSGSKSLQYLTVAMFTVFKNITIIFIALADRRIFGTTITNTMWGSFILIVASSLVGVVNDLAFTPRGYAWMVLNCGVCAAYSLYMRVSIKRAGFADFDSVYYNNAIALPILSLFSLVFDNWGEFFKDYFGGGPLAGHRLALTAGILASSVCAFAISYSTAWSMRVASSTTYSMVGALNKLPIAISGILLFPSERGVTNLGSIASILIAFSSGIVYCWAQIKNRRDRPKFATPLPLSRPTTGSGKIIAAAGGENDAESILLNNMEEANSKISIKEHK